MDDVLAVAGFARAQFPGVPLILAGFSFGGFVAAHARQRTEADGLILMGPAVGRYPVPMPAEVPADTLVIHGEEDEVIALSAVLDWARPQSLPVVVFPGTTHFFHGKLVPLGRLIETSLSTKTGHDRSHKRKKDHRIREVRWSFFGVKTLLYPRC